MQNYPILYLIIAILFIEIFIRILNFIFKFRIFTFSKTNKYYPIFPKRYIKIAIFGGSAAAGYSANINFASIIENELFKLKTKKKIPYIMNFAASGQPLYKGQSIIAKKFIKYFDLIIVYSGNNENQWYVQEVFGSNKESLHSE